MRAVPGPTRTGDGSTTFFDRNHAVPMDAQIRRSLSTANAGRTWAFARIALYRALAEGPIARTWDRCCAAIAWVASFTAPSASATRRGWRQYDELVRRRGDTSTRSCRAGREPTTRTSNWEGGV